jgi:hypothetical protein
MFAILWYQHRIRMLDPKAWPIAFTSPGAPSEVTVVGVRRPRRVM